MSTRLFLIPWCLLAALAGALGCEPKSSPEATDSQTNWLRACKLDSQCGPYACVCGVCTTACQDDSACQDGSTCVPNTDEGEIAQCSGTNTAAPGLCLPRCEQTGCDKGQMCVAGVCTPVPTPSAHVSVDTHTTHQTLTGFGASVAYDEGEITGHPQKAALYKTLFADLGLDVLRLRMRYEDTGDDDLSTASDLVAAAAASLGRTPTVFMTSWSPPAALKANNALNCSGNPGTCTLSRAGTGAGAGYDYAGFADYWRKGLDAYAAAGVTPDYIGLQNNPDWLPTAAEVGEACVFLPTEGTSMVMVNGLPVSVSYPGFTEALAATVSALAGLTTPPQILAPETADFTKLDDYASVLDASSFDALAHHLYGVDPNAVDLAALGTLAALSTASDKPIFQTEMQADGLGTAMLIHYTTTVAGGSAYLQTTLTSSATGPLTNPNALVFLGTNDYTVLDPYYAMRHFALHTDPGWTRVDVTSSDPALLASGWLAPDGSALTVIFVNAGTVDLDTKLDVAGAANLVHSDVSRTVFGGVERSAALGSLSSEGVLRVPSRSVVTIAFSN